MLDANEQQLLQQLQSKGKPALGSAFGQGTQTPMKLANVVAKLAQSSNQAASGLGSAFSNPDATAPKLADVTARWNQPQTATTTTGLGSAFANQPQATTAGLGSAFTSPAGPAPKLSDVTAKLNAASNIIPFAPDRPAESAPARPATPLPAPIPFLPDGVSPIGTSGTPPRPATPMPAAYPVLAPGDPGRIPLADAPSKPMAEAYGLAKDPEDSISSLAGLTTAFRTVMEPIRVAVEKIAAAVLRLGMNQQPRKEEPKGFDPNKLNLPGMPEYQNPQYANANDPLRANLRGNLGAIGSAIPGVQQLSAVFAPLRNFGTALSETLGIQKSNQQKATDALANFTKALDTASDKAAKAFQTAGMGRSEAGQAAKTWAAQKTLASATEGIGEGAASAAKGVAGAAGIGAALGPIGIAASATVAAVAALGAAAVVAVSALANLPSRVAPFVEALNPSAVARWQFAMRDLTATMGVALQPIITAATETARHIGSVLLPVMRKLEPVVAQVSATIGGLFKDAGSMLAGTLSALTPAFKWMADVLASVAPYFSAQMATFVGIVKVGVANLGTLFSSLFGSGGMSSFKGAMERFSSGLILATAYLYRFADSLPFAKALGMDKNLENFVAGVQSALAPSKTDNTGIGAATNASIGDLVSFGKKVSEAALLAGPGNVSETKEETWRREVLEQLKQMVKAADKPDEIADAISEPINNFIEVIKWSLGIHTPIYDPPTFGTGTLPSR